MQDSFPDAMGDPCTLDVNDNADGRHIIVSMNGDNGNGDSDVSWMIALTADQANALAETLLTLAAGI